MANENEIKIRTTLEDGASDGLERVSEGLNDLGDAGTKAEEGTKELEKSLKKLGLDFQEIETGVSKFERATINSFKEIANNSQASGKVISAAFEKAFSGIKSPEGIKQLESELEKLKNEGRLTENQVDELREKLEKLGQSSKQTSQETQHLDSSLDGLSEAANSLGGPFEHIGRLLETFRSKEAALAGVVAGLTFLSKQIVEVGDKYDKAEKHLAAYMGSQEKANEAMEYARQVANLLGTDIIETSQTWGEFDRNMKALGFTVKESKDFFEQLSHSIISTGGSMDDVREATEFFGESLVDGKVNAEGFQELLQGRLAPAFEEAAKSSGMTVSEFNKLIESGGSITAILPAIQKGLKNAFGDVKYIDDSSSAVQRFSNNLDSLLERVAKYTGINKGLNDSLNEINKALDPRSIDAWTKAWSEYGATQWEFIKGNLSVEEATKRNHQTQQELNKTLGEVAKSYETGGKKAKESLDSQLDMSERLRISEQKRLYDLKDAYELFGIESSESLKNAADKMKASFDLIQKSGKESTDTLNAMWLKLAEAEIKASEASSTPIPKILEQEARVRGLSKEYEDLVKTLTKAKNTTSEFSNTIAASKTTQELEKLGAGLRDWLSANEDIHRSNKITTDGLVDMNKQIDQSASLIDEWDNSEKAIQLTKKEGFRISQDVLDNLGQETASYDALRRFVSQYTDEVQRETPIINSNLEMRIQQNTALETEHRSRMNIAEQQGDFTKAAEEEAAAIDAAKDSLFARLQIEQNALESAKANYVQTLDNALADGQLTEAESALIQTAKDGVTAQEQKTQATKESVVGTLEAIEAERKYNTVADDFADTAEKAARRNARVEKEWQESMKQSHEEMKVRSALINDIINGWENRLAGWSEAAKKAFQSVRAGTQSTIQELDELEMAMKKNEDEMTRISRNFSLGFVGWANTVATQALTVERAFLDQAKAAEQLSARLDEASKGASGSITQMETLIRTAEFSKDSMNLLDDARLNNLKSSIESAKNKLEELKQEAQDARLELERMNAELAQEKGDTFTADQLQNEIDYKERLADIEEKLAEATKENNRDLISLYQQQKQMLESIYNQKEKNIKQEEEDRRRQEEDRKSNKTSSGSSSSPSSSGSSGTGVSSSSSTQVLQLKAPDNTSMNISGMTPEMVNQFVDILQQAGLRIA